MVSSNPEAFAATAHGLAARLALRRPLAFIDLETTGLSTQEDRIVQMAVLKLSPGGECTSRSTLVDPGGPIPPAATAVHGITDEQVAGQPRFAALAPQLATSLEHCDFAGFNVARFDLPLLLAEFRRAGCEFSLEGREVIDAQAIFHQRAPRTLEAALGFYCGRELTGAHDALADVEAALKVLEGQFGYYGDLPTDLVELTAIARPGWLDAEGVLVWREGELHLNIGRHREASRCIAGLGAGARPGLYRLDAAGHVLARNQGRPHPDQGRGCSGSGTVSPSPRRGWCPPVSASADAAPRDRLLETRQPRGDLDGAHAHSHDALDEVDEARGFVGLDVVVVDDPVEAGRVPLSGRSAVELAADSWHTRLEPESTNGQANWRRSGGVSPSC